MKTLVITGSIRSRKKFSEHIQDCIVKFNDSESYKTHLKEYITEHGEMSNCDILAGFSAISMKSYGSDVEFFPLIKIFPTLERRVTVTDGEEIDHDLAVMDTLSLNSQEVDNLKNKIAEADGIILVTPVYFGDRSSVANKLLQITGINSLLHDKVFACVAVGAKRNGGQETTIIYSLYEALNQNALVVGNGPPTSQYGGTAVGGNKGTVLDDDWGIITTEGTGTRVAHTADLLNAGRKNKLDRPLEVSVFVTMDDTKGIMKNYLEDFLKRASNEIEGVNFRLVDVLESTIYRCIACDSCPADKPLPLGQRPTKENRPRCIIKNEEDGMEMVRDHMLESDAIIIAGLNVQSHESLLYRYQALTERTRYIRRDNFELTNKLMTAFSLNQVGARINSLHSLKTLTSYIRHNAVMHKPIEAFMYNEKIICDAMDDMKHFVRSAKTLASGRQVIEELPTEYTTKGIGGY